MTEKKGKFEKLKDEEMRKVKGNTAPSDPVASSYYEDDENPAPEPPPIK